MPTSRPRYQITETEEVARALDAAELRWPGEPRPRLIVRLLLENGRAVESVNAVEAARRRAAIDAIGDRFRGLYPPGHREDLKNEWPA